MGFAWAKRDTGVILFVKRVQRPISTKPAETLRNDETAVPDV